MFILFRKQHKADKGGSEMKDCVPSTGVTPDCESVKLTGLTVTKETGERFVYITTCILTHEYQNIYISQALAHPTGYNCLQLHLEIGMGKKYIVTNFNTWPV